MCGRYCLVDAPRQMWADLAMDGATLDTGAFQPRYNIAPSQSILALRMRSSAGPAEPCTLRWGLIPSWAKDMSIGHKLINARSETVASKTSFRQAIYHRRCLVPASGFYEWKKVGRDKQPYFIGLPAAGSNQHPVFAMAGLWESWQSPLGELVQSCTILTREADTLLQDIHGRMPLIISPNDYHTWLSPCTSLDDLSTLLNPRLDDAVGMHFFPITKRVNQASNDDAACLEASEAS